MSARLAAVAHLATRPQTARSPAPPSPVAPPSSFRRVLACLVVAALALPAPALATDIVAAQPELPKERLVIVTHDGKHHEFMVEDATTPLEQETGLMFRPSVPKNGGMLFDWGTEHESDMWMKNTIAPLDMLFIGKDGTITHIAEDTVPQSLAVISSDGPVRATLELAAGVAADLDIRVGDKVEAKEFGNLN